MPLRPGATESPIITIGQTSSVLVNGDAVYRRVHNMYPMESGGFRSVSGPIAYMYNSGTVPSESATPSASSPVSYGVCRGIFHAVVGDGAKELLLLHVDDEIWEFQGWNQEWRVLVGAAASTPLLQQTLWDPLPSDFPTQWVRTPRGVIILPAGGGHAVIYDGVVCLPLGYTARPAPPIGLGPSSSGFQLVPVAGTRKTGINDNGYALDGLHSNSDTGLPAVFKYGRLGTVQSIPVSTTGDADEVSGASGYLLPGRYRCKQQWVNYFGDLSPLSFASNDVHFDKQPSAMWLMDPDFSYSATFGVDWVLLDMVRKEVAWAGLRPGPEGTIGKILWRTKDIEGKGDTHFYEVPRDASTSTNAFATIPDNLTNFFPDNVPDEWLFNQAEEIEPVPHFRLGELAFGSLIAANSRAEPGAVWVSLPGRYGTFPSRWKFFPDPEGAEVTGVKRVEGGALLFSRGGTYMMVPNDAGDAWRSSTLDANVGCVAPSSIKSLRNAGETIWLGRDGFYSWSRQSGVRFIFGEHREDAKRFNKALLHKAVAEFDPKSGQYRCWVANEASTINNLCWCYDGKMWTTRDDVKAIGVTVTDDHRDMMITCGRAEVSSADRYGVWVMDRSGSDQEGVVQTAWIRSARSNEPGSVKRVKLLLRETEITTTDPARILVQAEQNYRVGVISTDYVNLYPREGTPIRGYDPQEPHVWGTATWATATFRERRPFWVSTNVDLSSVEVFRLTISCPTGFEFIGFTFEEIDQRDGGARGYK